MIQNEDEYYTELDFKELLEYAMTTRDDSDSEEDDDDSSMWYFCS